jgi:eukaryotic-like serine/threonine-protein kinase
MKRGSTLAAPSVGSLLLGKYRLETVLGEGGMGVVYAAEHVQLEERVAVKLVRGEHANTAKLAARLVSEARATVRVKSDHVVRILDAGTLEDGQPFIVMEYLEGEDLSKLREREKQLPLTATVDYLLQACEAIAEAHSLGIVHRDLKPANLFLQRTPTGVRVKVLDFGISRVLDAGNGGGVLGATSAHSLVCSPAYASPEQLSTPELVDTRTDVWSLGVVCYELLTGISPFVASSLALVCTRVLHDTPARLRSLRRDAPAAVERALMLALRKRPEQRPQTIFEFAKELAPFGSPAARESLARIELIKPVSPAPPALTRRVASGDSATRTQTAWGSRIFDWGALRSERQAVALRLALALSALFALAFGVYQLLRPAPRTESAIGNSQPAAVTSPALPEPPRPQVPSAVTSGMPATAEPASPRGAPSVPAIVKKKVAPRAMPAAGAPSALPLASSPVAPSDPYLHRK